MKIALVHDYLNQYGGAERVLEELHDLYPDAPIYTSMYAPDIMPASYRKMDVRTSFMQRLPGVTRHHQQYLPFYPLAFESFSLDQYDVVLSNSSAFCKGIVTGPQTLHICYCLTPMRWVWDYRGYVERESLGKLARLGLPPVISALRAWDVATSNGVDEFIAISRTVAARIRKYYRRDSVVIYPPVRTELFESVGPPGDYYLVVSRLIPYKRIDLAVDAFNTLGLPLKIVGDGRDRAALQARARPNVQFLGRVAEDELGELFRGCRAFLFPGEEDFGIAPVEAQAAGRPVVAFAGGGALDTVVDGVSGVLFSERSAESLAAAVRRLEGLTLDPLAIQANAQRFDRSVFRAELDRCVRDAYARHCARAVTPSSTL
jgi:glycosyltransferase involved in cell wall biosynthesis